jgi:hypothetical protein
MLLGVVGILSGCSTLNATKEHDLNRLADRALAKMVLAFPGLQSELGISQGYLVVQRSGSWIPMVGKKGTGVLTRNGSASRSYFRLEKLEVKGAWGVGDYTGLMMIPRTVDLTKVITEGLTLENSGTLYIYARGEQPAAYSIKDIEIKPIKN